MGRRPRTSSMVFWWELNMRQGALDSGVTTLAEQSLLIGRMSLGGRLDCGKDVGWTLIKLYSRIGSHDRPGRHLRHRFTQLHQLVKALVANWRVHVLQFVPQFTIAS